MRNSLESWAAWGVVVVLLAGSVSAQQPPTFKSSVDLVRLDVTVVDAGGKPVDGLAPRDFDVRVNGISLPVTTLRYLELGSLSHAAAEGASTSTSAQPSAGGRIIVIAVDEESLPDTDSAKPLMETIAAWIDRLTPADRMSIVALPPPGVRQKFTSDKGALKRTLYRLHARASMSLAPPGAQGFGGNRATTASPRPDERAGGNSTFVGPEAFSTVSEQGTLLVALEDLASSLVKVEGPKTLVLVTAGLGFDSGLLSRYRAIASKASEARLRMYVLQPHSGVAPASGARSTIADSGGAAPEGSQLLAGLTGGAVFHAVARAEGVVARIERETMGGYIVGVELPDGTPRNKPLEVRVQVKLPGVTVRSPEHVVPPPRGN
jgi:VWFA-related protein